MQLEESITTVAFSVEGCLQGMLATGNVRFLAPARTNADAHFDVLALPLSHLPPGTRDQIQDQLQEPGRLLRSCGLQLRMNLRQLDSIRMLSKQRQFSHIVLLRLPLEHS